MSLPIDTIFQVAELVRRAIDLYNKIQEGPEQMKKIGVRMERLNRILANLERHLRRSKSQSGLSRLRRSQTQDLLSIIDDTREDCKKVYDLFDKWANNVGPFGIPWRSATLTQAYFFLGTNSDKLEGLARDIEDHRRDINEYMGLMGLQNDEATHEGIRKLQKQMESLPMLQKQMDALQKMIKAGQQTVASSSAPPSGSATPTASASASASAAGRGGSPAPTRSASAARQGGHHGRGGAASAPPAPPPPPPAITTSTAMPAPVQREARPTPAAAVTAPASVPIRRENSSSKRERGSSAHKGGTSASAPASPPLVSSVSSPTLAVPTSPSAGAKEETDVKEKKGDNDARPARPMPSPSRRIPKKDYKVLFVDPTNVGRSVVGASITALLKEWTLRAGGDWRIDQIHSAGFFVKRDGDCADVISKLDFSKEEYKMKMEAGGRKPKETAMAAVFDGKSFDHPFRKMVRSSLDETQLSTGVKSDVFKTYDFILVLTMREHDNMMALKSALITRDGRQAAPRRKGRVLHLGRYLTPDGIPKEIFDPIKNKDGTESRENWDFKVAQMRTAIEAFLVQEMEWKQPDAAPVAKAS